MSKKGNFTDKERMLEIKNKLASVFDKAEKFLIGTISMGYVSWKIRQASPCWIPEPRRWSHVAAMFWDEREKKYKVIESHFESGVVEYDFFCWMKKNTDKVVIHIFPFDYLNISDIRTFLGSPYGMGDIKYLALESIADRNFHSADEAGLYCSELIMKSDGGILRKELNIPAHKSRPTDLQEWALEKKFFIGDLILLFPKIGVCLPNEKFEDANANTRTCAQGHANSSHTCEKIN